MSEKKLLSFATKLTEKIRDPSKSKECYQSYLTKKNKKLVKQSKVIAQQPNIIENPNIADLKSSVIEHSKTSHKLSKTRKQAEKVLSIGGADNPIYTETKKVKIF